MPNQKHLLVVGGPTASGKTSFAIQLAKHFDTVIVSADSRQFFQEMNIGTAKPNPEELEKAKHYLVSHLSIEHDYSVGAYAKEAGDLLERLFEDRDFVILCGGSGLYIQAICEGLDEFPEVPAALNESLNDWYHTEGLEALKEAVKMADPVYFQEVDQNNPRRLLRALAVSRSSGKPFSSFRKAKFPSPRFKSTYLWMNRPRSQLYERINQRVDQMLASGLVAEARQLYGRRHLKALQTVGYQELFSYFDGAISLDEAIELIKRNSRRYAKRQVTWSRRDGFWKHIAPNQISFNLQYCEQAIQREITFTEEKSSVVNSGHVVRILKIQVDSKPMASLRRLETTNFTLNFDLKVLNADDQLIGYLLHEAIHRANTEKSYFAFSEGHLTNTKNLPLQLVSSDVISSKWLGKYANMRSFYLYESHL